MSLLCGIVNLGGMYMHTLTFPPHPEQLWNVAEAPWVRAGHERMEGRFQSLGRWVWTEAAGRGWSHSPH